MQEESKPASVLTEGEI